MLDHVIITVGDYQRSKEFYEKALKPLGYGLMEFESGTGGAFGPEGKPVFAIRQGEPHAVHVAFSSPDRATVDAFYEAATAAGGKDNGPPGLRPHYHEHSERSYTTPTATTSRPSATIASRLRRARRARRNDRNAQRDGSWRAG